MTASDIQPAKEAVSVRASMLTPFASVKMTVTLLVLIAATVLIGAWCPQESQGGIQKVIEQFGEEWALNFKNWGITDIFHTPWFLTLIAFLTINMIACSMQRVFPKVRTLKQPLPWLKAREISKLPFNLQVSLPVPSLNGLQKLQKRLQKSGYSVKVQGQSLVAEWGKVGRLAPTVTHIGLLSLLTGVTITSWTGFSGFQPVPLAGSLRFGGSEHSKLWIGKLPEWSVRVDATRRENYPNGDPKQWYSDLSVIGNQGKVITSKQISVNEPLSYGGVDIYQSSWGLDHLQLDFNGHPQSLDLRPMGKLYAAFLPLDEKTVLIFSVRDQGQPLRVFGKTPQWPGPRLLTEISPGKSVHLGTVALTYNSAVPVTGLQYKCDPGLPITFVAFAFIMCGVLLAAVPHRQVWVYVADGSQADAHPGDSGNVGIIPADAQHARNDSNSGGDLAPVQRELSLVGAPTSGEAAALMPIAHRGEQVKGSAYLNERLQNNCILYVGGRSLKGRTTFERSLSNLVSALEIDFGVRS